MTPVVVWDVIRGIILPSAVLPQPMGPRNLPFAFAYALCPAGTLYRNSLPITNVCVPTRNVIESKFKTIHSKFPLFGRGNDKNIFFLDRREKGGNILLTERSVK